MDRPPDRRPDTSGTHRGLAYSVWLPDVAEPPWPGVVILHGAGSCKENHADFGRLAASAGFAALAFDQRGHGESEGEMGPDAVADVSEMAWLLAALDGVDPARVAVRGSSMGGFMAICAAARDRAIAGAIAICPAWGDDLARGVRQGRFEMRLADPLSAELWLADTDLGDEVEALEGRPLFLMHAEGDDQIPAYRTAELHDRAGEPKRLLLVPGGNHRSLQHDAELQADALRWLAGRLEAA